MARPITYEYRRPGKPAGLYQEWLVLERPDVKVLLLDPYEGKQVFVSDVVIQDSGAPIVWYVFPDRWYDVGRLHRGDGTVTGWYTNLCLPPILEGDRWIGNDLFLDLWQPVAGGARWLDEDELEQAMRDKLLDRATRRRIDSERALIELRLRENAWPPPIARDIDLAQARSLRDA